MTGLYQAVREQNWHLMPEADREAFLNQYLPEDIAVVEIEEAEERFHARYHATSKTYVYRIHTSSIPDVFERKYKYTYTEKLDVTRMKAAAAHLIGTHDFMAVCGNKKMKKSTVRTIMAIEITEKQNELVITYTGDGFLQQMIRIITGTLIGIVAQEVFLRVGHLLRVR